MINVDQVKRMIEHWLATPVNGYFYQSYGSTVKEQLLKNQSAFLADQFLEKMKKDIPILQQLPSEQLNLVSQTQGFDGVVVYVQLGYILIEVGKTSHQVDLNQDYYDVTAR